MFRINLVAKAAGRFERINSNFESSTVGKTPSKSIHLKRNHLWKEESNNVAHFIVVLFSEIALPTAALSNHHPDQSAATDLETRPSTSKKMMTPWRLRWCSTYFNLETKCCVLRSVHCLFRHKGIAHLTDFHVNTVLCAVEMKKFVWFPLLWHLLYCPGLEPSPQYLWGWPLSTWLLVYVFQRGTNTRTAA